MALLDYYGRVVGKSIDHPENDHDDDECARCHGDGMDPYSDYLVECPWCQPEQEVACRRPTLHLRKAVQP
jgi:hypothetical protein